jgi:serine/threonine protein kinase
LSENDLQYPEDDNDRTNTHIVLTKGTMVSHYRIVKKIGAGGMGEVYLAEDTKLGRKVALKFLPSQSSDDPDSKARFINEACASAALDHPNICPVYEIDDANNRTYIAMAFIDGESLREKTKSGPMNIDNLIRIGIDIAKGLEEAHDKKIIHRDIKSANVMISGKGQVKITDFGLARLLDSSRLTKAGIMMGTVAYMSPEQVRAGEVDHRSDIWSLGIVLYEMATGKLPFKGERDQAVTHQILSDDAEPISSLRTGIPLDLERIINKCLEKDPSNRYQHVDDLAVDLRNVRKEKIAAGRKRRSIRLALPIIAVLAATVLYLLFKSMFEPTFEQAFENPLSGAIFTKITDIEGSKDAAISPDGKFVAFVSDYDGEFDIWVSQVETGSIYNRTLGQFGDMRRSLKDVDFTANSSEILSYAIADRYGLQSMPLLDGPWRRILRDSVIMAHWSQDGGRVVYFTYSPGDPVFVANADGTNSREILASDSGMHQHYQRWSVDGEWIYMTRGHENTRDTDLWRIKPDGSQLEQLTENQLDVTYPVPINEEMVMFIARDKNGAGPWIWAIDVETKICRRVSIGFEKYNSLSASQDGLRLVTTVVDPEASLLDIWSVPILDTIATELNVTKYAIPVLQAQAPRFGDKAIYFLSSRGMGDGLWKYGDGVLLEVWSGARSSLSEVPSISPDGQSVAIALKREGKQHIHLIGPDGSNLRLLSDSIDVRGTSSFSPDGKWIAIAGIDAQGQGLFKISIVDGRYEKIIEGVVLDPVWSPKGDLIVYGGKQLSGFLTLEAVRPNGKVAELPEIKVWVRGERFRFIPDGSGLVYMGGFFSTQDFWLLDLSTMESRKLTNLAKGASMRTFDISPDRQNIVFDRVRVKTEIVLIELADDETIK